jgi:hypothetical protein
LAEKIREIPEKVKRNSLNFLIVSIWSIVIAGFIVNEYLAFVYSDQAFVFWISRGGIAPPFHVWQGAGLNPFEVFVVGVFSFICGIIIVEINKVLYGSVSALIISFAISSVYIGNFIWNVGGWGQVLSITDAGWSWALYWGILNTFRAVFPIVFFVTVICAFLGAFVRELVY